MQKPERGAAPHLTEPEMNSGLGAKLSVARAANMKTYMVAPASATTAAPPKAEHGRVGVERTLSAQEASRPEGHSCPFSLLACYVMD